MHSATLARHQGYDLLQVHLMQPIDAIIHPITDHPIPEARHDRHPRHSQPAAD